RPGRRRGARLRRVVGGGARDRDLPRRRGRRRGTRRPSRRERAPRPRRRRGAGVRADVRAGECGDDVNGQLTWYVARAGGIVTWGLLVASMIWGLLYATRVLGRRVAPWWLLGVHRFLGALAVVFMGVHVVALLADGYIDFGV